MSNSGFFRKFKVGTSDMHCGLGKVISLKSATD